MSTTYLPFSFYLFVSGFSGIIWAMIIMLWKLQKEGSAHTSTIKISKSPTKPLYPAKKNIIKNLEHPFLKKLNSIILHHLNDEDLSIAQVCEKLNLSHSQVYRKVKKLTGKTPSQYIRSLRLDHAQSLIKTTSLNISEVAFMVGFKELSYFSRVFQNEYGVSPSMMRKVA